MKYEYKCAIKRVVDGDTVELEYIDLGFGITIKSEMVRISGIDTPECRTSDKTEKIFGLMAKERVQELLPVGSEHTLLSQDFKGKFGRILGDILIDNETKLTETLLNENLAVPYGLPNSEELHLENRKILTEKFSLDIKICSK